MLFNPWTLAEGGVGAVAVAWFLGYGSGWFDAIAVNSESEFWIGEIAAVYSFAVFAAWTGFIHGEEGILSLAPSIGAPMCAVVIGGDDFGFGGEAATIGGAFAFGFFVGIDLIGNMEYLFTSKGTDMNIRRCQGWRDTALYR